MTRTFSKLSSTQELSSHVRQRRDQRIRWRHESRIWLRSAGGYSTPPKAAAAAAAADAGAAIFGRAGRPSPCRPARPPRAGMDSPTSSWDLALPSVGRTCLHSPHLLNPRGGVPGQKVTTEVDGFAVHGVQRSKGAHSLG